MKIRKVAFNYEFQCKKTMNKTWGSLRANKRNKFPRKIFRKTNKIKFESVK